MEQVLPQAEEEEAEEAVYTRAPAQAAEAYKRVRVERVVLAAEELLPFAPARAGLVPDGVLQRVNADASGQPFSFSSL
jgi:hypothetical protein